MTIPPEILDEIHKLETAEKLALIQIIAADLAAEHSCYLRPGATYDVWAPNATEQAVKTLNNMLPETQRHG